MDGEERRERNRKENIKKLRRTPGNKWELKGCFGGRYHERECQQEDINSKPCMMSAWQIWCA